MRVSYAHHIVAPASQAKAGVDYMVVFIIFDAVPVGKSRENRSPGCAKACLDAARLEFVPVGIAMSFGLGSS